MSGRMETLSKIVRFYRKRLGHYPDYWYWKLRGQPKRSPHLVKQRTVIAFARRYGLTTLIETGTYFGEMVAATRKLFSTIHTIEYDPLLASLAQKRFARRPHIHVHQGDSQIVLLDLLKTIDQQCLFWLDGGYFLWENISGSQDRLNIELEAILSHPVRDHVVLMDDARAFNGTHGVPRMEDFLAGLRARHPERHYEVQQDTLCITPKV